MDTTGSYRPGTTQTIAYSATVPITNAFGAQTKQVRLIANSACHFHLYDVGGTATATTSDPFLPPNWETFITVTSGQKISAIRAATGGTVTATDGTLWVTEFA